MEMIPTPTRFEALNLVLECYGSQSEMARKLGVSQPAVWKWLHQSKQMPAEFVLLAEQHTGISRHWLRPDIYPAESRLHGVDRRANRVLAHGRAVSAGDRA